MELRSVRKGRPPAFGRRTCSQPCYGCCYPFVTALLRVRPQFRSHFTDVLRVLRLQRGEGGKRGFPPASTASLVWGDLPTENHAVLPTLEPLDAKGAQNTNHK